jgi:hypothetical protein
MFILNSGNDWKYILCYVSSFIITHVKSKAVPLHAMVELGRRGDIALLLS